MAALRFPQSYVNNLYLPSGSLPITGAAPIQVNGNAIDAGLASLMVAAVVSVTVTTSAVAVSGKWQVFCPPPGGGALAWTDVVESNNPANVTIITGTGTLATVTKVFSAPLGVVAGNRQARFVCLTTAGTGAGGTADLASIAYEFRSPTTTFGS